MMSARKTYLRAPYTSRKGPINKCEHDIYCDAGFIYHSVGNFICTGATFCKNIK